MRLSILLVLIGVLLLVSIPASADTMPIVIFNTGVQNNGDPLPDNVLDPHYTLIDSPSQAFESTYTLDSATLINVANFYTPNTSISKWIAPSPNGITETYYGEFGGNYTYRTTFHLPGTFDPLSDTAFIAGMWASDNTGVDILINETSTGNSIPNGCQYRPCSFQVFTPFSISTGFRAGVNTLDFVVWQPGGNLTGVHIQIAGEYEINAVPEPSTLTLLGIGLVGVVAKGCDVIVCWEHNWKDCPSSLEVIELKKEIKALRDRPEFRL